MILFKEDYAKYPTAIIDTETTNKSFLRLASVYKEMGVENHAFPLVLINPNLKGVDPFDPNLTQEQTAMILFECYENPWYFLREVAMVPAEGGGAPTRFQASRANVGLWWCFFNHATTFLIQPRQTGKSFAVDTLDVYLLLIRCSKTKINLLTKDEKLRLKNVQQIKDIIAELPYYLQIRTRDDINNTEQLSVKALGNWYTAHVPQPSEKKAYNMGRGLVTTVIRIDESPFQTNIAIALPALLAATGAAFDMARASGAPYGITLTTTAGKRDDKDGKFIYNILSDAAVWTEKFFDCENEEKLRELVVRNSRSGDYRINITLNHRQLGRSDEWLMDKIKTAISKGEDADRDYFNIWTAGSQTNPLHKDILEKIVKSKTETLFTDISKPYGYITRWYIPENEIRDRLNNSTCVLGMDTSEASGGDDISLVIVDVETLEVLAVGNYNETNFITFSEWVCAIFVEFPRLVGIIERRSTGATLLDYLLLMLPAKGIDPFRRLYNRVVQEYDENRERFDEIKLPMNRRSSDVYVRYKKAFGFATSSSGVASRTELYSTTLQLAAKRSCDRIHDKSLIDQITGLTTRNGRIDHEVGEHDDLVIGWLLIHFLITQGKNLAFYGIDISTISANIAMLDKPNISHEESVNRLEQQLIRDKIEELYDKLSNEADDFICMKYEHELRVLDKKLILETGEMYSLDEVIKSAKEARKNRNRIIGFSNNDYGRNHNISYVNAVQGNFSNKPIGNNMYRIR